MLEHLTYLPGHVLGLHIIADVTIDEYKRLLEPLLSRHVKQNRKINLLLILEGEVEDFEPGAWCGNTSIGLKYFTRWNKLAVVTDREGIREFSLLFKYIIPGQYKGYKLDQLYEAVKWVSEK